MEITKPQAIFLGKKNLMLNSSSLVKRCGMLDRISKKQNLHNGLAVSQFGQFPLANCQFRSKSRCESIPSSEGAQSVHRKFVFKGFKTKRKSKKAGSVISHDDIDVNKNPKSKRKASGD